MWFLFEEERTSLVPFFRPFHPVQGPFSLSRITKLSGRHVKAENGVLSLQTMSRLRRVFRVFPHQRYSVRSVILHCEERPLDSNHSARCSLLQLLFTAPALRPEDTRKRHVSCEVTTSVLTVRNTKPLCSDGFITCGIKTWKIKA